MATDYSLLLPEVLSEIPDVPDPVAINALRNAAIEFCQRSGFQRQDLSAVYTVAGQAAYTMAAPTGYVVSDILKCKYVGSSGSAKYKLTPKTQAELDELSGDWESETGDALFITQSGPRAFTLSPYPPASTLTISAVANTSPIQITTTDAHGLATGDAVSVSGTGVSTIDDTAFLVTVIDATNYTLDGTSAGGAKTTGTWSPSATLTIRAALKPTAASTTMDDTVYEEYHEAIAAGAVARLMTMPQKPWSNPQLAVVPSSIFESGVNAARSLAENGFTKKAPVMSYGGI